MLAITDNKSPMVSVKEKCGCGCRTRETRPQAWVEAMERRGSTPIESFPPYQEGIESWADSFLRRGISPLLHRSTDFIVSVTVETEVEVAVEAGDNWSNSNRGGCSKPQQKTTLHQELIDLQVPFTKDGSPGRCFIEMVEFIGIKHFFTLGGPVVARIFWISNEEKDAYVDSFKHCLARHLYQQMRIVRHYTHQCCMECIGVWFGQETVHAINSWIALCVMGPRGQVDLIDFQRPDENCKFLRIDMDQEMQTLTVNIVQ